MDTVMKQRELFFNNLLILGFDKSSVEKDYRITCDKNMFCVPNQKMFEVVTYFLFSKLNQVSKLKYSIPWPLMDKDQHRQFQKSCFNHLSKIAQESNVKFPRIVSSLLSTFGGDRFYELYLAFSSHVVQRTIIEKNTVSLIYTPTQSHQNNRDIVDTLKIATILSVENFQEVQSFSLNHFKLLLNCAKQYVTQIQNLKLNLSTNCSLLEENINKLKTLYSENQSEKISMNDIVKKSIKYEKKVKDLWLPFEKFLNKEKQLWSCVSSEVERNSEKYSLNGSDLHFNISDNILKNCSDLNKVDLRSSENEKLNIFKYLKSFYLLLEFYIKSTLEGELLQVTELCSLKQTALLDESLNHIQTLNENLVTNILPHLKDSTKNLEDDLLLKEFSEDLEVFVRQYPSWSCCSKNFQKNAKNIRQKSCTNLCSASDGSNPSCLFDDTSIKDLEDASQRTWFKAPVRTPMLQRAFQQTDNLCIPEIEKSNLEHNHGILKVSALGYLPHKIIQINESFESNLIDIQSNFQENTTSNAVNDITDSSKSHNHTPQLPSFLNIEDFEVDIDYSGPFKMRESWLKEESLSAMTLDDLPELE